MAIYTITHTITVDYTLGINYFLILIICVCFFLETLQNTKCNNCDV